MNADTSILSLLSEKQGEVLMLREEIQRLSESLSASEERCLRISEERDVLAKQIYSSPKNTETQTSSDS